MQNYRRAAERHNRRVARTRLLMPDTQHGLRLLEWYAAWMANLRAIRDELLLTADRYRARLRHERDHARRGNKRRRGQ